MGAVENRYRKVMQASRKTTKNTGSVDIDSAFKTSEPQDNRWDYGMGLLQLGVTECAVWIEPHPASEGDVKTMLKKLEWLRAKINRPEFSELNQLTQARRAAPNVRAARRCPAPPTPCSRCMRDAAPSTTRR